MATWAKVHATQCTVSSPDIFPITVTLDHPTRTVDRLRVRRLVGHVIAAEGYTPHDVGIILTDHATVLELNQTYLDHNYHTDVLSFALHDASQDAIEGEVYIDLDTAAERHEEFGTSFEEEVLRYIIHGVLHLLGYEDATPTEKALMHEREDLYLATET